MQQIPEQNAKSFAKRFAETLPNIKAINFEPVTKFVVELFGFHSLQAIKVFIKSKGLNNLSPMILADKQRVGPLIYERMQHIVHINKNKQGYVIVKFVLAMVEKTGNDFTFVKKNSSFVEIHLCMQRCELNYRRERLCYTSKCEYGRGGIQFFFDLSLLLVSKF